MRSFVFRIEFRVASLGRKARNGARPIETSYTLNEDPHPQVLFTFGFSNLKPAPSSVST
jgi:hypothetical protein